MNHSPATGASQPDKVLTPFARVLELGGANLELFGRKLAEATQPLPGRQLPPQPEPYRGVSPVEIVYQFDQLRVLRYLPAVDAPGKTPLLLVPSMINRAYIMDLMPNCSLAAAVRAAGVPVYLVEWGTPGPQHDHLPWATYIDDLLGLAVRATAQAAGSQKVGLLGYCMGGTMALLHAALHPETIERITLLASPANFHDEGVLSQWSRSEVFDVDRVCDTLGHMDCGMLQGSFLFLKPLSYLQKLESAYEMGHDARFSESFVALERWLNDNVNVPGETFRDYVKLCYHENALMSNTVVLNGEPLDLRRVTMPLLNVMAAKDHIVPVASSQCVKSLVGGPVEDLILDAGHIGIAMGRRAREMFSAVARFHGRA